jgi:hypothetical protein
MNKVQEITEFKAAQNDYSLVERVVMQGDLSQLSAEQRVMYYRKVCESTGLNPYTRPFDYIQLNGKLTLYAKKDATDQLRKVNGISIDKVESKIVDELCIVTARASTKDGRTDESTGVVVIGNLRGDAKANALMKAESKAKRRVTLSISGMGWTDETEIETIPGAKKQDVCMETGEIKSITKQKADELTAIVSTCLPDFIEKFYKTLNAHQIQSIETMPVEMYERAKFSAVAAAAEAQKQKMKTEEYALEMSALEAENDNG